MGQPGSWNEWNGENVMPNQIISCMTLKYTLFFFSLVELKWLSNWSGAELIISHTKAIRLHPCISGAPVWWGTLWLFLCSLDPLNGEKSQSSHPSHVKKTVNNRTKLYIREYLNISCFQNIPWRMLTLPFTEQIFRVLLVPRGLKSFFLHIVAAYYLFNYFLWRSYKLNRTAYVDSELTWYWSSFHFSDVIWLFWPTALHLPSHSFLSLLLSISCSLLSPSGPEVCGTWLVL